MPIIDFKEIPEAHIANGHQDTFEQFAKEFLETVGFSITYGPTRGRDEGMDLIVIEKRIGLLGKDEIRWLVSCKHKAHSGRTVVPSDEKDILKRVLHHRCDGFLGFYSTGISAGFGKNLEKIKNDKTIECNIFCKEDIEKSLLDISKSDPNIFKRYFPVSCHKYIIKHPAPAKFFTEQTTLNCKYCGEDLLFPEVKGNIVYLAKYPNDESNNQYITDIFFCCKGGCDEALQKQRPENMIDLWDDIADLANPMLFIRELCLIVDKVRTGTRYSDKSIDVLVNAMLVLFKLVSRQLTVAEEQRAKSILSFGL